MMAKGSNFIKPVLFLIAGLVLLFKSDTLLWVGCLMLSAFYFAIDVLSVGKRGPENSDVPERHVGPSGVLGSYVVDATDSYGLFIRLLGVSIFVDIKKDEFLERREQRALFLFQSQKELENNLINFMNANSQFKSKTISYIGLHSKKMEQGEVFWKPNGYTLLKELIFLPLEK